MSYPRTRYFSKIEVCQHKQLLDTHLSLPTDLCSTWLRSPMPLRKESDDRMRGLHAEGRGGRRIPLDPAGVLWGTKRGGLIGQGKTIVKPKRVSCFSRTLYGVLRIVDGLAATDTLFLTTERGAPGEETFCGRSGK